jgi:diketogulonate reductase-like aldo/keto reductase
LHVQAVGTSLQRLGMPCVDVVQLYWNSYRWARDEQLPATRLCRHARRDAHSPAFRPALPVSLMPFLAPATAALHARSYPRYKDAGLYLMDLKAAGKVRHISVTNMDTQRLMELQDAGVEVATNQVGLLPLGPAAAGAAFAMAPAGCCALPRLCACEGL